MGKVAKYKEALFEVSPVKNNEYQIMNVEGI